MIPHRHAPSPRTHTPVDNKQAVTTTKSSKRTDPIISRYSLCYSSIIIMIWLWFFRLLISRKEEYRLSSLSRLIEFTAAPQCARSELSLARVCVCYLRKIYVSFDYIFCEKWPHLIPNEWNENQIKRNKIKYIVHNQIQIFNPFQSAVGATAESIHNRNQI